MKKKKNWSSGAYELGFQQNYPVYILLTIFFIAGAIALTVYPGDQIFIYLNGLHNAILDQVFPIITYLGDAILYIGLALFLLFRSYGYLLDFSLAALVSSIFVQSGKRLFFADSLRPLGKLGEEIIHVIEGVQLHMARSFPSGHSTSAMLLFLYLAIIVKNKSLKLLFICLAFIGGFSRIYLSQHFFEDVYAGFAIGTFSVLIIAVTRNVIGKPSWYDKYFRL